MATNEEPKLKDKKQIAAELAKEKSNEDKQGVKKLNPGGEEKQVRTLSLLEMEKSLDLRKKDEELRQELSAIGYNEWSIAKRKEAVHKKMDLSAEANQEFYLEIQKKYGQVQINFETGEIYPVQQGQQQ